MSVNQVVVRHTTLRTEAEAGIFLAGQVLEKLGGHSPNVLIVFASPEFDYVTLLQGIAALVRSAIPPRCPSTRG